MNTIEAARHRWREVLPILGIETRFLVNKHGPCPICGGTDRFRFDDKNGAGTWFCNACRAGGGIDLVCRFKDWDFATAAREIDKILGTLHSTTGKRSTPAPKNDPAKAERNVRRALDRAREPGVVAEYLKRRGISVNSPALLGDSGAAFYDADSHRLVGYFAAVLAPILSPKGELCSAAVIYTSPDAPQRKKFMPKIRTISAAAVRLFDPTDELAVTEGIENALSVREMWGLPAWAALNDNGVSTFEPPAGIRRLIVAGDADASFAGQAAAFALAKRLRQEMQSGRRSALEIEVRLPPQPGVDWNDILRGSSAWR